MSTFRTAREYAPVANAFVEVTPSTIVGIFSCGFAAGPDDQQYIRPGGTAQQDYLNADGAEWLLYTRSVLSYRIEVHSQLVARGGASLIIDLGDGELMGAPVLTAWKPIHLMEGDGIISSDYGIELPGLLARFRIQTASPNAGQVVSGSIIVRGI
jgi:hypothetical protein